MTEPIRLIFLHSRPGGGKNIQTEQLIANLPHAALIHPGEMITRAKDPSDPEYGKYSDRMKPFIEETQQGGIVVPPDLVGDMVSETVTRQIASGSRRLIFNGFPRGLMYLPLVDRLTGDIQRQGNTVEQSHVYIDVSETTALRRIAGRRDQGRADDAYGERRMREFDSITLPMVNELRRRGILCEVDGERSVKEVSEAVRRCLAK